MTWDPEARLLTIAEAAESVGRPAVTIRRWLHEGRLVARARQGRSPLVLELDVLRLDADTRTRRRRASRP